MIRDGAANFARQHLAPACRGVGARPAPFRATALREMGKLGFLGMTVPAEWGGAGTDYVSYALAMEEIAAGDAATACVMSGHNSVGCGPLVAYGTPEQKEKYLRPMARGECLSAFALTEPSGGSDAAALAHARGAARRGVCAERHEAVHHHRQERRCVPGVRQHRPGQGQARHHRVHRRDQASPGYRVGRIEKKMGQNASDTCEIHFDDMDVPVANRLGAEGQGYRIALSNLEGGRIGIAAQAIGIARAAYELALAYAQERKSFGKVIYEYQAVSHRIADMATQILAARLLVLHAAELRSRGLPCLKEASMAKLFASDMAERVCSDAVQTFGGAGYIVDFGVERLYRAARVTRIYEGTNDIQRLVISRAIAS